MNTERKGLVPPESKEFEGKVVLITGGSSGIGLATALYFQNEGAQVAMFDIGQRPNFLPKTAFRNVDVSDSNAVSTSVNAFAKQFGDLDIVVNNAAIKRGGSILEVDPEDFKRMLMVNGFGFWNVAQATLPYLIKSHGALINVCSGTSQLLPPNVDAYFASKGVSYSLTHSLASSFRDSGVRILGIAPGPVDTNLWRTDQSAEKIQAALKGQAGPKVLKPEDIAQMILSLASNKNAQFDGRIYSY